MGTCSSQDAQGPFEFTKLPEPLEFEPSKSRLNHLVMIGDVTPNSARVWVKVPHVGYWQLVLSKYEFGTTEESDDVNMEDMDDISQASGDKVWVYNFLDKEALTHCFHCEELEVDTRYYYRVLSLSSSNQRTVLLNHDQSCFLRTSKSHYSSLTVGFYSCHDPFSSSEREFEPGAWHGMSLMADQLDLIIGGGDQVYVDSNEPNMTDLWVFLRDHQQLFVDRYAGQNGSFREHGFRLYMVQLIRQYYLIYWNSQDISNIFGRVPSYMIWDDHEIMDGWGSLTADEKLQVMHIPKSKTSKIKDSILSQMVELTFQACAQVYNEYQHCRNPTRRPYLPGKDNPTGFEWDFSFQRGPEYQFYTLDMRGNHDCTASSDRLLGRSQYDRILEWLDVSITKDTKAIFVTSPVPFVHWSSVVELSVYVLKSLKDDLMDAWSHPTNQTERDKILSTFFYISHIYKIPIVILCGDVHCMSAYTLTDPKRFPCGKIITITSSAISRKPCPSVATKAFQGNGFMKTKVDGKGVSRNTTIVCEQKFAKSGVHNYAAVKADGKNISCTFYWVGKTRGEMKNSTIKF